jgi:hypothetical protein
MREADYEACSNEALAEAVCQLHALICATQAEAFAVLRVLAAREAFREDGCRDLASWLVMRLGVSGATERGWAETAGALGALPKLEGLLSEGRVSLDQLRPVAKVAMPESEEALAGVLPGLSAAAAEALGRRTAEVDPRDEREAHRTRRFSIYQRGECPRLSGSLPTLEGETVRRAIERIAEGYGPDPGSGLFEPYEMRMADALDPDRAQVVIYVQWEVLAGAGGPAETGEGHALGAESARRAACDCRSQLLVRDRSTVQLDLGRTRSIPPGLKRYLRHRDGGCRFPGCRGRRLVQGHHITYWRADGPTDRANLVSLCRGCHRRVHEGGWQIEGDAEGTLTFVAPNGRRISGRPAPLRDEVRRRILGERAARAGPDPPAA